MICKECDSPIERLIEGERICEPCWTRGQMTEEELALEAEAETYMAEAERNAKFAQKLAERLGFPVVVSDDMVVFGTGMQTEILNWYEPMDLMADEWAAFIRNCLKAATDALDEKIRELAADFGCNKAELIEALINLAYRGDTTPAIIAAELRGKKDA